MQEVDRRIGPDCVPTTAEKRSQGCLPCVGTHLREEVDTPPTSLVAAGVLPSHRYDQRTLTEGLLEVWNDQWAEYRKNKRPFSSTRKVLLG